MTVTEPIRQQRLVSWPLASAVVLYFAVLVAVSFALPSRVPLHWGVDGRPDSYGPPATFAVAFAVPGVVVFLAFFLAQVVLRRGPVAIYNVPYPWYWKRPEQLARLRSMVQEDLNHIFTGVFLFLILVLGAVTASVLDRGSQLSWLLFAAIGLLLLFIIGYLAYMFAYRYRPPEGTAR